MSTPLSSDILLFCLPTPPPPAWVSHLQATYPGLTIRFESTTHPDNSLRPYSEIPASSFDGATILVVYKPPPAELLGTVRFVQLLSAGSDLWKGHAVYEDKGIRFCNASGVQPVQIAEWVVGCLLMNQHKLGEFREKMKEGVWEENYETDVDDCYGYKIGILGYGSIGRQVARLSQALGMQILAYTAHPRPTPESKRDATWSQPGQGDPDGLLPSAWYSGTTREAVNSFLAQDLDVLVIAVPLTDATRGLIGREQFEILGRKRAFVVNIARGAIVDQGALREALDGGVIRGAAVDVTEPEPLPVGDALWGARNLLITPHVAWKSKKYWQRILQLTEQNLGRLAEGGVLFNEVKR